MGRHLASLALASGVALAIAGPVAAWDSVTIAITNAAGGTAATVAGGEVMAPGLLISSVLDARPAGDLGPRFTATYAMGPGGQVVATQDLYPYAAGGPVSYTATAGAIGGHRFAAGWRQTDRSTLEYLVGFGLPAADPASNAGAEVSGAAGAATDFASAFTPSAIAVGLLTAVGLTALLLGALRRLAAPRQAA